jgi:hypothetical protein
LNIKSSKNYNNVNNDINNQNVNEKYNENEKEDEKDNDTNINYDKLFLKRNPNQNNNINQKFNNFQILNFLQQSNLHKKAQAQNFGKFKFQNMIKNENFKESIYLK